MKIEQFSNKYQVVNEQKESAKYKLEFNIAKTTTCHGQLKLIENDKTVPHQYHTWSPQKKMIYKFVLLYTEKW